MSVSAQMKRIGEIDGVTYYWAESGQFAEPGVWYWDGHANKRLVPSIPVNVDSLSDGMISQITMDELGKWPTFEAQSWACKVVHAVLRTMYRVNPFAKTVTDKGPWSAGQTSDHRAYVSSDDFKHDVLLRIDGDFGSQAEKMEYAEGIAQQLNGKMDSSVEAFLRELAGYAPQEGVVVGPTALMGIGIKARLLLGRMKKDA